MAEMQQLRQPEIGDYVEVLPSRIHGKGLFARRLIPEGTAFIEYGGELLDKDTSNQRGLDREEVARKTGEGMVYIFELNDQFDIDGSFEWNIARLANHSCAPNAEAQNIDDHIWFVALRDIKPKEEITFDYGYGLEHFINHPCHCGASNCVGYIVNKGDRRKLKKLLRKNPDPSRIVVEP
jgi:uncharacterized protein